MFLQHDVSCSKKNTMYHIQPEKKINGTNECTTTQLVYLLRSFVFLEIDMASCLRMLDSFLHIKKETLSVLLIKKSYSLVQTLRSWDLESHLLTNDTDLAHAAAQCEASSVCVASLPTNCMHNQKSVTFLLKSYLGFKLDDRLLHSIRTICMPLWATFWHSRGQKG
jgi:hypothetical protein